MKLWGVGFSSPVVNPDKAEGRVELALVNHRSQPALITVKTSLINASGSVVVQKDLSVRVPAKGSAPANLSFSLNKPLLWSVDQPNLYKLRVT